MFGRELCTLKNIKHEIATTWEEAKITNETSQDKNTIYADQRRRNQSQYNKSS